MTSQCYLDSLNLDVITEVDHLNGYCYCSKCTCGKHICPRPASKRYPKSTFNSYYKLNYKRHSVSHRPASSSVAYKKSQFKMQSETTTSHDFQAYDLNKSYVLSSSKAPVETNPYKFHSYSVYRQDFNNWGTMKTEMIKQISTPVGTGVRFNATTTYSKCFSSSPGKPSKKAVPHVNTNILCTGDTGVVPQTTMKASFAQQKAVPSKAIKREDNTMNVPAFPNQYATVNSVNFNAKELGTSIRRARKPFD